MHTKHKYICSSSLQVVVVAVGIEKRKTVNLLLESHASEALDLRNEFWKKCVRKLKILILEQCYTTNQRD